MRAESKGSACIEHRRDQEQQTRPDLPSPCARQRQAFHKGLHGRGNPKVVRKGTHRSIGPPRLAEGGRARTVLAGRRDQPRSRARERRGGRPAADTEGVRYLSRALAARAGSRDRRGSLHRAVKAPRAHACGSGSSAQPRKSGTGGRRGFRRKRVSRAAVGAEQGGVFAFSSRVAMLHARVVGCSKGASLGRAARRRARQPFSSARPIRSRRSRLTEPLRNFEWWSN